MFEALWGWVNAEHVGDFPYCVDVLPARPDDEQAGLPAYGFRWCMFLHGCIMTTICSSVS